MRDYTSLALKNVKRRGLRSWLTLLGIFIGVAAVISLLALGNGLREAVISQFGVASSQVIGVQAGGLSNAGPPGAGVSNHLTKQDAEAIGKLSLVESSIPINIRTIKAEFNKKSEFTTATSVPEDRELMEDFYEILDLEAEVGNIITASDVGRVALGYNFGQADKNEFSKAVKVGDTILVNQKKFKVQGILEKKGSFIYDNILLMRESELKDLLNYGDEVDLIDVKIKNKDSVEKAQADIEELMRDRRDVKKGEEDFEVSTPSASLETINSVLRGVQIFVVMIALVSILVGALGIVNTMTTSVLERRKEIGIMKAIGARNRDIFYQFFIEAGLLGLVGGFAGILIGLLIGWLGIQGINSFVGSDVGIAINFFWLLLALVASFLIGAISGIAPALHAARQKPVEALRG